MISMISFILVIILFCLSNKKVLFFKPPDLCAVAKCNKTFVSMSDLCYYTSCHCNIDDLTSTLYIRPPGRNNCKLHTIPFDVLKRFKHLVIKRSIVNGDFKFDLVRRFDLISFSMSYVILEDMIDLSMIKHLIELKVTSNEIKNLKNCSTFPMSLKIVELSSNKIEFIEKECFHSLHHLISLDLEDNKLYDVDLHFRFLVSAPIVLKLSKNNLKTLSIQFEAEFEKDVSINDPITIEYVSLESNLELETTYLSSLPLISNTNNFNYKLLTSYISSISSSKTICSKKISLDYNNRSTLIMIEPNLNCNLIDQRYFSSYNRTFALHFNSNFLNKIPNLNMSKNLIELNLDSNELTSLHHPDLLPNEIEVLSFVKNRISVIDQNFFVGFKLLKKISLEMNLIVTIDKLRFNSNRLKILDLSSNQLSNLNELVFENDEYLENLEFYLRNNSLTRMPILIGRLNSIKEFRLARQKDLKIFYFEYNKIQTSKNSKLIIDNFDLRSNSIDSIGQELLCNLNLNIIVNNLILFDNYLDIKFICLILNDFYPLHRINIDFFPQKKKVSCSDITKATLYYLQAQMININCNTNETRLRDIYKCSLRKFYCDQSFNLSYSNTSLHKILDSLEKRNFSNKLKIFFNLSYFFIFLSHIIVFSNKLLY